MASVRKAVGKGNVRARPRAREKREEERVLLPHSSRALHASQVPKISFSFSLERLTPQARLSLKQWKNGMFLFVTLRFLSNLRITLIASFFFYFLHVSVVCFNVSGIN